MVEAATLRERHRAVYALLNAKRGVGQIVLRNFFVGYVGSHSTKSVAIKFFLNSTSIEEAFEMPFPELLRKLREARVTCAYSSMLRRIVRIVQPVDRHLPRVSKSTFNIGIFIAAYFIVVDPGSVFTTLGVLESKLFAVSQPMLECFHKTAAALRDGLSSSQVCQGAARQFSELLCHYIRAYQVILFNFYASWRRRIQRF
jgi:hypothetical protein